MTNDWILRVGTGVQLKNGFAHKIWGVNCGTIFGKGFMDRVQRGDRLWFVPSGMDGKIMSVATYGHHTRVENDELFNAGLTLEALGWENKYNVIVHYSELYDVSDCDGLFTKIKGTTTIRQYRGGDLCSCMINLPVEYRSICRYRTPI